MLEREFSKKIITPWLKEKGVYYFKPRGGPYSTRKGIPDYILCISGRFIGLEVKNCKNKLTDWQEQERANIRNAGGMHFIVRPQTWECVKNDILKLLTEWDRL